MNKETGLNPTTEVLEEKIADLEGGEAALAQASGMAAISAAVLASVKAGDHVIADEVIYGSTYDLFVVFFDPLFPATPITWRRCGGHIFVHKLNKAHCKEHWRSIKSLTPGL